MNANGRIGVEFNKDDMTHFYGNIYFFPMPLGYLGHAVCVGHAVCGEHHVEQTRTRTPSFVTSGAGGGGGWNGYYKNPVSVASVQ